MKLQLKLKWLKEPGLWRLCQWLWHDSHTFEAKNVLRWPRPLANDRLVAALGHKLAAMMLKIQRYCREYWGKTLSWMC